MFNMINNSLGGAKNTKYRILECHYKKYFGVAIIVATMNNSNIC